MSQQAHRFDVRPSRASWRTWIGFAGAAARRSSLALVGASFGAVALLNIASQIGTSFNVPDPDQRPLGDIPGFLIVVGCQCVCLVVAIVAGDEAVDRGGRRRRSYVTSVVLACLAGAFALFLIRAPVDGVVFPYTRIEVLLYRLQNIAIAFTDELIICGLCTFVYVNLRAARQAGMRRHAAEIARLDASRHAQQSRLQAMQARVEPQFLFNTLTHVRALYETDAVVGGKMLDDLIAYFRAALPSLRDSSSTVGKEAALARAYLDIVRGRPGDRLAFATAVPAAHLAVRMPPMMLLPLIDHALARVPEASRDGRTITLETGIDRGKLLLSIADSGAGFEPVAQAATLDAIRERLHALYGNAASLTLERDSDRGSRAVLEIPHEPIDRGHR